MRSFTSFPTQRSRGQLCPVVPGHLPDHAGAAKVELAKLKRGTGAARPY